MVRDATRALVVTRATAAFLLVATAVALSACGDSSSSGTPAVQQGGPSVGAPIQLADCTDWQQATVEERLGTIAQIRNYTAGPNEDGQILEDDVAYDTMEGYCKNEFARAFRLYKLYGRAASFTSQ